MQEQTTNTGNISVLPKIYLLRIDSTPKYLRKLGMSRMNMQRALCQD